MKKSIFLFFAAILCAMSASAKNVTKPRIYYDNSNTSYSNVAFVIGHNNYSRCYKLTKISNTNLWYRYLSGTGNDTWTDATQIAVFGVNWDSSEGSSISNRRNYTGDKYTNTLTLSSDLSSGKVYLVTASGNKSTTSIALKSGGYADLNYTQTVQQQLTTDGTTYNASTEAIATVKVAAYKLNDYNTTASNNGIIASGNSSATCSAARTATVTYTVSGVNSAYTFVGWYDGDTQKSTSSTYTYEATEAKTITARFAVATEEEHEVTITYVCGSNTVSAATSAYVGVGTEKTFTAPTVTGYQFKNWTVGAGMTLKVGTENDATITVVTKSAASDYTLVANYEEVMETIYFINTGKWSVVNLHRWGGTATETPWPGKPMTSTGEKIGEYDVYSFTAQQGAFANVIFTNKNTGSDQTDDLTWTAGKYYIYNYGTNNGWYTKEEAEALLVVPVVTHDIVVKAVVPEAWTGTTIGIHYWGDGISGTSNPVATEKDGNWNKYTIKNVPEGVSVNVIFLNGTSWPDDKSKQTANITGITEDKCFQISATKLDGEGKSTVKEVDCDADIKPEGDVYTIMGAGELGLSWDLAKTGNDMTKQADGTYTLVKEGLDLATTGSYEYKVVKNHSWDWSIPSGNTNQTLKVDKDGTYTVTFTLSADKTKLTAGALCTAEKEVILDCSVAGTINLVGGTADFTDKLAMTYDEGTKTYSKTFTALPAGNYQMKVVYGSDWLGYDKLTKPVPANVTEGDDKKIKFSLAEAGDVTVTYNVEKGIGLVGNFAAPAPEAKKYYVKGTHNEWTADATSEMTLDEDVYKKEVTLAKDVEFKINDGADGWWGKDNLGGKSYNELEGLEGGNLKMKEAKTFTIIFSPTANLITFEGLTEKAPAAPVKCYLMGNGDWDNGVEMEEDGTQFKLLAHHIYAPFKFKYGEEWSDQVENYDFPGINWTDGNIVLPEGIYDFYFKKATKNVWIVEAGYVRNVTNKYGTICLPYASASTTGATFYRVAGKETGKVYLESVDALEAGVPYIFEKSANQIKVVYTGEKTPTAASANGLVGTFEEIEVPNGMYILYNNAFCTNESAGTLNKIKENRAYLNMEAVTDGAPTQMPGRRYIGMSVQGENEATGFENITAPEGQAIKVIESGQLIIIRNGEKFNAQGQKL